MWTNTEVIIALCAVVAVIAWAVYWVLKAVPRRPDRPAMPRLKLITPIETAKPDMAVVKIIPLNTGSHRKGWLFNCPQCFRNNLDDSPQQPSVVVCSRCNMQARTKT